jgi:hypothetical protein
MCHANEQHALLTFKAVITALWIMCHANEQHALLTFEGVITALWIMCHADEQHALLTFEGVLLWRGWLQLFHQLEGFLQLALPQVVHSQVELGLRTHIQQAWQDLHHTSSPGSMP